MTNEPPREVWLEDDYNRTHKPNNQATVFFNPNKDIRARHKYILASRVEKMIRLAVLEKEDEMSYGETGYHNRHIQTEINQLLKELQ